LQTWLEELFLNCSDPIEDLQIASLTFNQMGFANGS
jgi:hypothetical protein